MKSLAITSGKGGVGKSNVAANLGLALARRGHRILLVDADLGLANQDILFGFEADRNLADVIEGRAALAEVLVEVAHGMRVLPGASGVLAMEQLPHATQVAVARQFAGLADEVDLMIVDTAAGLGDNVIFFCAAADRVLLVTTPEPPALTDAYALVKILRSHRPLETVELLVNQVHGPKEGFAAYEKVNGVVQRFLGQDLGFAGYLVKDPALEQAVRQRRPVLLAHPLSPVGLGFESLAHHVATFVAEPVADGRNFWQRVISPEGRAGGGEAAGGSEAA